ncbi:MULTISPECIES: CBS domain-containing protein [Streptomyces]|nr:CBS domain-containing protein [Streptomyces jietaisiensis]
MTSTGTHTRRAGTDAAARTAGPQVWDDMTVEVALSLMAAARTRHLVICDADGRRTGRVTLARLTAVRNGSGYTDQVRLRDLVEGRVALTAPPAAPAEAGPAPRHRPLGILSRSR